MALLNESLREKLPRIGADPSCPMRDTLIHARIYDPSSAWNWYVMEYDGDETLFGLIATKHSAVAGQFTVSELEALVYEDPTEGEIRVRLDPDFEPLTVGELAESLTVVREFLAEVPPRESHSAGDLVTLG